MTGQGGGSTSGGRREDPVKQKGSGEVRFDVGHGYVTSVKQDKTWIKVQAREGLFRYEMKLSVKLQNDPSKERAEPETPSEGDD